MNQDTRRNDATNPPRGPVNTENSGNAALLKENIDRGHTGDKVDVPDPAAAPLGTDAEAGGRPASPAELAEDQARQRMTAARAGDAIPVAGTRQTGWRFWPLAILLVVAIAVGIGTLIAR